MAVIRLELEIDSEVYPELHAALAAVGSPTSRGERFRQLAATGLVWETVRIHGASVTRMPASPVAAPPPPAAPDFDFSDADLGVDRAASERTFVERRTPQPNRDFIDLALNASPPPEPAQAPAGIERRAAPRHVPMLMDVVTPPKTVPKAEPAAAAPPRSPAPPVPTLAASVPAPTQSMPVPAPLAAPMPVPMSAPMPMPTPLLATVHIPAPVHLSTPAPAPTPGETLDAEPGDTAQPDEPPEPTTESLATVLADPDLTSKPPVRSRLMRMKEMGLFKNG